MSAIIIGTTAWKLVQYYCIVLHGGYVSVILEGYLIIISQILTLYTRGNVELKELGVTVGNWWLGIEFQS